MNSTYQEVRLIVSDIFNVSSDGVSLESSTATLESWDSMQHLSLMMALEEKFQLEFEPEEIEKMTSVRVIVDVIDHRRAAR